MSDTASHLQTMPDPYTKPKGNGTVPVPGYGHGSTDALEAAITRNRELLERHQADLDEQQKAIEWIDLEVERLGVERENRIQLRRDATLAVKQYGERLGIKTPQGAETKPRGRRSGKAAAAVLDAPDTAEGET